MAASKRKWHRHPHRATRRIQSVGFRGAQPEHRGIIAKSSRLTCDCPHGGLTAEHAMRTPGRGSARRVVRALVVAALLIGVSWIRLSHPPTPALAQSGTTGRVLAPVRNQVG
jgi:hypothetical protein